MYYTYVWKLALKNLLSIEVFSGDSRTLNGGFFCKKNVASPDE